MPEPKRPLKVFLCHAHADRDPVRGLYTRLTNDGVDAWLDKAKLLPGQDWELEIRKAVREADVVVVCLSKQFNQAGFRQKEVRLALDTAMEQPDGEIFIIPARLEECDTLESLRKWHWVDLFADDGHERLTRALQMRADKIGANIEVKHNQSSKVSESLKAEETVTEVKLVEKNKSRKTQSKKKKGSRKLDTAIIVALIGVTGTIIAALLGSPLIDKWFPTSTPPVEAPALSTATETVPVVAPSPSLIPATTFLTMEATHTTSSTQIFILESFPAPGLMAEGITWDGSNLWLSDNSGLIFKMDKAGKVLDNFKAPEVTPEGLTWDGSSFWMFTTNYSLVYQFQIVNSKAATISTFPSPGEFVGGDLTQDMAWDGKSLWYANQFKVFHLDTSGKVLDSFVFPKNVTGLDWDGSNLWLAYNDFPNNATLAKVSTDGNVLKSYPSPVLEINGLVWVDEDLWALGLDFIGGKPTIYKLSMSKE